MTAQSPSLPDAIETVLYLAVRHETVATIADAKGTITYASRRFCEMTGFRESELVGKDCRCLVDRDLSPVVDAMLDEAEDGEVWSGPLCLKCCRGCERWADASVVSVKEACGSRWFITLVTERET